MTVSELIDELNKYDGRLTVTIGERYTYRSKEAADSVGNISIRKWTKNVDGSDTNIDTLHLSYADMFLCLK